MNTLTRAQAREIDRRAVDEFGLPSLVLMENAGRGCVDALLRLGMTGPFLILCGPGNNGGDGFVIARHLDLRGHSVQVVLAASRDRYQGDAAVNLSVLEKCRVPIAILPRIDDLSQLAPLLKQATCVIDALLGTGFQGETREPIASIIDAANNNSLPIVAIDLPSGLDADSGQPSRQTIRAAHTFTFVALKQGFLSPAALPFLGTVQVLDIGAPRVLVEAVFGGSPRS